MQFFDFMFVPAILFITIVMPIWLILHYRAQGRAGGALNENDHQALDDLLRNLDKLSERIETLEAILDDSNPRWREDAVKE
ncbi:envelope stress response membrane protein PspB [Reinekea marinisedimentorum]|uniref:Phage shock protein B n=1 Tax=Reinekea marinisedimentorum TaxID=230495 RepID=A0A4V2UKC7_9GAMM|nr:envelope stress response membrane protein PspB [Reinekea marinisedimentorum]TCS43813.1 phage shock protein B [Reinekea marinisedimentorum]